MSRADKKVKAANDRFAEIKDFIPASCLFYAVVEPKRPPETYGEGESKIILTQATRDADKATNQAGRLLHLGSLCYATETPGLSYAKDTGKAKVGDWIFYSRHAGTPIAFVRDRNAPVEERANRIELVILTDTDILSVLTQLQVDNLVGWSG